MYTMEVWDVLKGYHTRDIFVGITECGRDILGTVKWCPHDDGFWVTVRNTTRS